MNEDILAACLFLVAVGLLALRDRLAPGFLAPDRRRDVRAAVIFVAFVVALFAVALVVSAVRG